VNDNFDNYTEQDTLDTLILPYLTAQHGFPRAESLDYQAQHTVAVGDENKGRFDGLYLQGGYPYVVLEAKRHAHDLTDDDVAQARSYAVSSFFDKPVPVLIVSNGREWRFLKQTTTIDPSDGRPAYVQIPPTDWKAITHEPHGEVRQMLTQPQLLAMLRGFKTKVAADISRQFLNSATQKLETAGHELGPSLDEIIVQRKTFIGDTAKGEGAAKRQSEIKQAIEGIALHFTIKILFIKLIEDLARGADSVRIVHTLFPQREYDQIGGLFGYKVLASLSERDSAQAMRLFSRSKRFYKRLGADIARVSWADIFRYGFSAHTAKFGQLFRAKHYDKFLPNEDTLASIRDDLIAIDIRTAVIYGSAAERSNVIGDVYERLIDDELRTGLGAVYTPDVTMKFMVDLGQKFLGGFRGNKIVEPACGSGHFYREIYRRYVDEVFAADDKVGRERDGERAHQEALSHVYGRDIDPFAVQLTLLSTFLEQLKDNISPATSTDTRKLWLADRAVDTQNSLDRVTIDPTGDLDIHMTKASAKRALNPDLLIGNPPYGVRVEKGPEYGDIYELQSPDSYGYFIANALKRLPEGKRAIYIVSSSFLTIGSHRKLRETILKSSKIVRVIKLHRATFPGIDTFPVIIELERCDDAKKRADNFYHFYDLWQMHPKTGANQLNKAYTAILNDLDATKAWPFEDEVSKRYTVRQGLLDGYEGKPIFEGKPSLYEFMADISKAPIDLKFPSSDGQIEEVRAQLIRGVHVVKLNQIGSVRIGLQSGANSKYYRTAPGVKGGAAKGGYHEVPVNQIVSDARLASMTPDERTGGIEVDDPSTDAYFVPLDKAGLSEIENGLLAEFWRPVEFYVNWSRSAVEEMKGLKGAVFRNSSKYFETGVSFSNTGIYSPFYRLGHGGVFDQKGSNIFCNALSRECLLGILSSTLLKYFAKSFLNHGVDSQIDDLPIVMPNVEQVEAISDIVKQIIAAQKQNLSFDYRPLASKLDDIVDDLYKLDTSERAEIRSWHKRHYPKLHGISLEEEGL
jgi:type I restriction-modification system DNA methylase subunit